MSSYEDSFLHFRGKATKKFHDYNAVVQIEMGRRFVKKYHRSVLRERPRDHHHLQLAIAQFTDPFICQIGYVNLFDGVIDYPLVVLSEVKTPTQIRIPAVRHEFPRCYVADRYFICKNH